MCSGAAKVARYPCHCCPVESDNLAHFKVDNDRCTYCIDNNNEHCICWDVNDNEYLETIKNYLVNFIEVN